MEFKFNNTFIVDGRDITLYFLNYPIIFHLLAEFKNKYLNNRDILSRLTYYIGIYDDSILKIMHFNRKKRILYHLMKI